MNSARFVVKRSTVNGAHSRNTCMGEWTPRELYDIDGASAQSLVR